MTVGMTLLIDNRVCVVCMDMCVCVCVCVCDIVTTDRWDDLTGG